MSWSRQAGILFGVDGLNAKHLHEPTHMIASKEDSILIAQRMAQVARSIEGTLRVQLIKRVKRSQVFFIHARYIINACAGDVE